MPRKHNSFERALVDAEKRLAQALNERSQAQETLNDLAKEIPNLQRTVAALESQLNPAPTSAAHISGIAFYSPEQVAKMNTPTEEDLLPEPDGTPLTPED